jgi:glycosyltransferase involved in cell wall biosynthesis
MNEKGFDVIMISSSGSEIEDLIDQEKCTHIVVPFERKISLYKDILCLIQLIRILHRLKPDIVHTHSPKAGLIGMIAAFICRVPIRLHTIAGLPWINYKGFMYFLMMSLERISARLSTAVYPNSYNLLAILVSKKIGIQKLKVIGPGTSNGIDLEYFSPGIEQVQKRAKELIDSRNIKKDALVWVYIGRIVNDKGIGELIDSFIRLKEKFPNDELWLVGEEEPDLDPLSPHHVEILQTSDSIVKWGFHPDVRPFLSASKLLVFPSHREGFPNVPLQAACMQCAMILTDINGCNEIVENQINGLLVPFNNASRLYEAMHRLREDSVLRLKISSNARDAVSNKYAREVIWNAILNEYLHWLRVKKIELSIYNC